MEPYQLFYFGKPVSQPLNLLVRGLTNVARGGINAFYLDQCGL